MATTYTLHVPTEAEPGDPEALDEAELVRDGFAQARDYPPDLRHADSLDAAEEAARDARSGIWGEACEA